MARKRSRSRSPSPSEYIFTGDRHSIQSHPRQDFGRQNKRQARRPAQPTEAMDALRTAAGHDTAPATTLLTTSANLVYRIRYGVLPYNNSLGHAEVGEGPTTGYTNDADLAMLAAGFSSNYRLQGIRWEVQEVRVGATGVRTLMRMDNGPVELKNGTWATFHDVAYNAIMGTRDQLRERERMEDERLAIYVRKNRPNHGTQDDMDVETQPEDQESYVWKPYRPEDWKEELEEAATQ
ncbi:hypothetical protein PMIN02_003181 [Paraphaeosphaeria minitans]